MASGRTSTLPYILHEYSQEFQPQQSSRTSPRRQRPEGHGTKRVVCTSPKAERRETTQESSPKPERRKSRAPQGSPSPDRRKSRAKPVTPPVRESSFVSKQRQDKEKNERMFEFWQTLKEDVRDQESDRLLEKLTLQQKLIRAQDQHHEELEERRRRNYYKKRQKAKAERDAKFDALQEICRQSLEEDRRNAPKAPRQPKVAKEPTVKSSSTSLHQLDPDDSSANLSGPPGTCSSSHNSLASVPLHMPLSMGDGGLGDGTEAFMTLREEDEDDEQQQQDEEEDERYDEEVLPWHHVQLYQLYGRNADYFLHPKIETEQKTTVQLNPRLKAIGGRAGAGVLWKALRNDSRMRLLGQDSKLLSPELKSAFGAFTREGVMKKRQPVRRNYNAGDDVPDLARLMDQSKVYNAQDFRHKVELMFRSSIINQDRTKVLLYNNPTPNLNNKNGVESIQRYMPSWADQDKWDQESEYSYKKWLRPKSEPLALEHYPSSQGTRPATELGPSPEVTQSAKDWQYILKQGKRREHTPQEKLPNFIFLTEEGATCKGEFSKRRKELAESKHIPQAYGDRGDAGPSQSALSMASSRSKDSVTRNSTARGESDPSPKPVLKDVSDEFQSSWQPLSLTALAEYKENTDALGQGQFNQGKTPVWTAS